VQQSPEEAENTISPDAEDTLAELEGLVSALEICLWELAQERMTGAASRARSATIAIGDALEQKLANYLPQ
jgi:hypothetical protein